jgi:GTP-binding protein
MVPVAEAHLTNLMNKYIVTEAEFVASAPTLAACPDSFGPEVAFAGRSNVGKSSLLNFLAGKKQLARVSSTPGRTRLLNFFRFYLQPNYLLGLVDLPGYGFARISQEERRSFGPMLENFLFGRKSLKTIALLIDIRRNPEDEEKQVVEIAQSNGFQLITIITKTDEVVKSKRFPRQLEITKALGLSRQPILTSVTENMGHDEVWRSILGSLFAAQTSTPTPE